MDPVVFDASGALNGDDEVIRSGLLFRAGSYEDKNYSMTEEELAAAVEAFTEPVELDLEHTDTILSHKLGRVTAIEARGDELHGTVALPKWLDDVIGAGERKVSATWDRATKTLQGLALVLEPRVADAALMSYANFAAARHDTPHGQMAIQGLHDQAARSGAVCDKGNASMASRHENVAIQSVHDLTVKSGAQCAAMKPGDFKPGPSMYANEPGESTPPTTARKERPRMSFKDTLKSWFDLGMPDEFEPAGGEAVTPPVVATPTGAAVAAALSTTTKPDPQVAEMARIRAESERFQQENRELKMRFITEQAAQFAADMLREGRAVPAEHDAIIAAFTQAATDDMAIGTVTFADGTTAKTRVALLKEAYSVRLPHQLTQEHVLNDIYAVANQIKTTKPSEGQPSPERMNELIAMTATGAAFLRDHQNGSN